LGAELDEDSIKYSRRTTLPSHSLAGLEEQIYTCIKCLEKLTCRGGVASEGYWFGFEMLSNYKREFLSLLQQMDPEKMEEGREEDGRRKTKNANT
jgi:hypothetical protein